MPKPVLIVEDDDSLRESLQILLEEEGARVLVARDGEEAMEVLRSSEELPALILLDLMMPRMDGWALRRRLRADRRLATIPIVIVSALPDLTLEAKRVGAIDFFGKPLDMERLHALVAQYCAA
jgi:DNA-binding response OmpR family regulator